MYFHGTLGSHGAQHSVERSLARARGHDEVVVLLFLREQKNSLLLQQQQQQPRTAVFARIKYSTLHTNCIFKNYCSVIAIKL
jgi:hypothetical protein